MACSKQVVLRKFARMMTVSMRYECTLFSDLKQLSCLRDAKKTHDGDDVQMSHDIESCRLHMIFHE